MPTYYPTARTNYVSIRAEKLILAQGLSKVLHCEVIEKDGKYAFIGMTATENEAHFLNFTDLSQHLDLSGSELEALEQASIITVTIDGVELKASISHLARCMNSNQLLIYMESGYEGNDYVNGYAVSYDSLGQEITSISIHDIYHKVAQLTGLQPTEAHG